MKRILTLLAAFVALTGCRIEEAEYFDPADNGSYFFQFVNSTLSVEAACAARVMLFDRYYSASEEERETLHDRYFYSSRIVRSGDEWHIIDSYRELVIYTDGQSLSAKKGAAWRYKETQRYYQDGQLPTITCCTDDAASPVYELLLPDGGGQLFFMVAYTSQPQENGSGLYLCELQIKGRGQYNYNKECYGFEKVDYEIVEPLKFASNRPRGFSAGTLTLTTETENDELNIQAEYAGSDYSVWISCGKYKKMFWY